MSRAKQWKIGEAINGRWEINNILSGGMGTIYIVYDNEWNEPLAVKTVREDILSLNPGAAERFIDEARSWIKLDEHENTVHAKFVQIINERPYLFLEYVNGGDLSTWIGGKRLQNDVSLALRFAIQFCDGMVHANSKGIYVHRDIKPQNCLITDSGVLKVTDFGLAKAFDNASHAETPSLPTKSIPLNVTGTGTAVGTCTHMAPEQFVDSKHVDIRADVYSFGITLFQMVTGNLPFRGKSWLEYIFLHKHQPIPHITGLDRELNTILRKCMAKVPSERFKDFLTLRRELGRVFERLTGQLTPSPKSGRKLDAHSLVNKGVSLKQLGRIKEAISCYEKALVLDATIPEAWANMGSALAASAQHREAIRNYERCLTIDPKLQTAWLNKAKAHNKLGENAEAVACCDKAHRLNPNDDEALYCRAIALSKLGKLEEAFSSLIHSLQLNPINADCLFSMGVIRAKLRDYKNAVMYYGQVTDLKTDHLDAWFNKAHALQALGDFEGSIDACNRFISLKPTDSNVWTMKGAALEYLHQYNEAIDCFKNAVRLGHPRANEGILSCKRKLASKK